VRKAVSVMSFLNGLFAVVSILPCLMAGLMSMDSPQSQSSVFAHVASGVVLSFPLVCAACAAASPLLWRKPKAALAVACFPVCVAAQFFGVLFVLQWLGGAR
jgi:hypothetical protein